LTAWHLGLLAVALALASLWPLAGVFHWFGVNIATLEQLGRNDPMGFRILPAALMFLRPSLAAAASLWSVAAAVRVVTAPPLRAPEALIKTATAQGLIAIALAVLEGPLNSMLSQMLPMFADRRTPGAFVTPGHFVGLQEAAAAPVVPWLFAIGLGSAALGIAARYVKAPERRIDTEDLPGLTDIQPAAVAVAEAPPQGPSPAATVFKQDTYEVRPRPRSLTALIRHDNEYDIRAAAHARSNQEDFSYSMTTGRLCREPDGAVLLTLSRRNDGTLATAYDVTDDTSRHIGIFVHRQAGWDMQDALGRTLAEVIREDAGAGRALYVARATGKDVCRYTWSTGAGPMNPLLLIDFESRTPFDRALAIALAPYLEEEARLISQKHFRY
jgi:hypothetical protein